MKLMAQLRYLTENTGVLRAAVLDHGTVEFFAGTHRTAKLEKLDGIRAMCNGLPALGTHLPRALERIVALPILLTGRLLHQHKRPVSYTHLDVYKRQPQEAAEKVVFSATETIQKSGYYCDNIALVCMNAKGECGAACNHQDFTYTCVQENQEPVSVNVQPIIDNGGVPPEV